RARIRLLNRLSAVSVRAITVLLGGLRIPSFPPGLPVQFADLSATSPFPGDHRAARSRLVESARALGLDACQKGWRRQENESSHLICRRASKNFKAARLVSAVLRSHTTVSD